jgi:hypothetical protein
VLQWLKLLDLLFLQALLHWLTENPDWVVCGLRQSQLLV